MFLWLSRRRSIIAVDVHGRPERGYFFSTPQNTVTGGRGFGRLTFARTAPTACHSPSGMWVTTCVLSTCASVAILRFYAGSVARA